MSSASRWAHVALLAGALLAWVGPASSEEPGPSILLVTFDTTRADHLGAYGYELARTPAIDALASRGVLFESAVSTTPVTLPSHVSILTGTYPTAHGVRDNALFELAREAKLVPEVFRSKGWRTAAFVGSFVLDSRFGLDQGFETYSGPADPGAYALESVRRPASEVVDDAIAWLASLAAGDRFFVWVHFFDPHQPLRTLDERGKEIERPYDDAISYADAQLGRLQRYLQRRELDRRLVTVVTADHGEGNGEHGEKTHGIFLYHSVMRVPLIFSASEGMGWKAGGRRIENPVSNAAIAPTLLEIAGLDRGEMPDVKIDSLLSSDGAVDGGVDGKEPSSGLYLESIHPYYSFRWRALRGIVRGDAKLIRGVSDELYSLDTDPDELDDGAADKPEQVAELQTSLEAMVRAHAPLGWVASREVSNTEIDLLESLGYATPADAKGGADDPFASNLPDPRARIGDLELIDAARDALRRWSEVKERAGSAWQRDQHIRETLEEGRKLVLQLKASNPDDPNVPRLLGIIEDELGNPEAAIPLCEKAVAHNPTDPTLHARLASAYAKAGRTEDAIDRMEHAISLAPRQSGYYRWLIDHLLNTGKFDAASRWMDRFAEALESDAKLRAQAIRWIAEQRKRIPAT